PPTGTRGGAPQGGRFPRSRPLAPGPARRGRQPPPRQLRRSGGVVRDHHLPPGRHGPHGAGDHGSRHPGAGGRTVGGAHAHPDGGHHDPGASAARRTPMMRRASAPRPGISLLEVITAFVIFLLSYVAISDLINQSAQHAALVELQELATVRCQSKLAEVVAGALPLSSQEGMPYDDDANWTWSLQCEHHGQLSGLWNV